MPPCDLKMGVSSEEAYPLKSPVSFVALNAFRRPRMKIPLCLKEYLFTSKHYIRLPKKVSFTNSTLFSLLEDILSSHKSL